MTRPEGFEFRPGMSALFSLKGEASRERGYSLASSPLERDFLEITAARAGGDFTEALFRLRPGDGLSLRGPVGDCVYDDAIEEAVLVAGGTGLAPHRSMARYVLGKALKTRLTLVCSAAIPEKFPYRRDLEEFRRRGVAVHMTITRPELLKKGEIWNGGIGRIDADFLEKSLGDLSRGVFFLCGPAAMVKGLHRDLTGRGLPPERLRAEPWALR